MPTPPFLYRVAHVAGSRLRILVNEVLVYDRDPIANVSPAGAVSQFLVPGVNTVVTEVTPSLAKPQMAHATGFQFEINRYPDEEGKDTLFGIEWQNLRKSQLDPPDIPHFDVDTFELEDSIDRPAFLDAEPADFPEEGTNELHRAVEGLHAAFAAKDRGAFVAALDLQVRELERPYGSMPHLRDDPEMAPLEQPWAIRPYDPREVRFERRAGGRIAQPFRRDGSPVLHAVDRSDPKQSWVAWPQLTKIDGRWRIFHV